MAQVTLQGNPFRTVGELPALGASAPDFTLVKTDLSELTLKELRGKRVVLNVFPSVDTSVCAASVRTFNKRAGEAPGTVVLCVSMDLPFAGARFCGAEGLQAVHPASAFRSDFGKAYGLTLAEGPLKGLLARAVLVLDEGGTVKHVQLVPEIAQEPDYDAALAAAK